MTTTEKARAYLRTDTLGVGCAARFAEHVGMNYRTMRRQLAKEGVIFHDLLEDERKARVEALLSRNRHADGRQVLKAIGLRGEATAGRKFQQWFGMTLSEYRAGLEFMPGGVESRHAAKRK